MDQHLFAPADNLPEPPEADLDRLFRLALDTAIAGMEQQLTTGTDGASR